MPKTVLILSSLINTLYTKALENLPAAVERPQHKMARAVIILSAFLVAALSADVPSSKRFGWKRDINYPVEADMDMVTYTLLLIDILIQ